MLFRSYSLVRSTVTDRFGVIYLRPVLIVTRLDSSPLSFTCLSRSAEYDRYNAMDVDRTRARLANIKADPAATEAQWREDQRRWNQNKRGGQGGPPMRPRGGFLQRSVRFNFDNVQCYKCQQMGHIACQCPQHPWNQPLGVGPMLLTTTINKKNPSK